MDYIKMLFGTKPVLEYPPEDAGKRAKFKAKIHKARTAQGKKRGPNHPEMPIVWDGPKRSSFKVTSPPVSA